MNYKIKVYYNTGDSFGTYEKVELLDYGWKNKEVAEQNLIRIKSHANWYENDCHYYNDKTVKPDFVHEEYDFALNLLLDDGSEFLYSTDWCDYFGSLTHAVIESDERLGNRFRKAK